MSFKKKDKSSTEREGCFGVLSDIIEGVLEVIMAIILFWD
jgi:hypothetical protein